MKRFKKILCVVEPERNSEAAIIQATNLAKSHQASLSVMAFVKKPRALLTILQDKAEQERVLNESIASKKAKLEEWVSAFNGEGDIDVNVAVGTRFVTVIESVIREQYDLVIKCCDEAEWLHRLFGSDDMHLLRKCPCPVLMLEPGQTEPFEQILATVDVSGGDTEDDEYKVQDALNREVLAYAASLSLSQPCDLHIGSVWEALAEDFLRHGGFSSMPEEKVDAYVEQAHRSCVDKLDFLLREMNDMVGREAVNYLRPRSHLVKGRPEQEIPAMAEKYEADLVVMGTVARTGIPGFIIGNTAESVLEQVQCSVLAIKPKGFKSPVDT